MSEKKFMGYRVTIACFFMMFFMLGPMATIGVYLTPIADTVGLDLSKTNLMVVWSTGTAAVLSFFSSNIIRKLGQKRCLYIGSVLLVIHFVMFGMTQDYWYLNYGSMIGGIVCALSTVACNSSIVAAWFIENRSKQLGIAMAGTALGTAFWQWASGVMITYLSFRQSYYIMAAVCGGVTILINAFLIRMPEQVGQKPLGWEKEKERIAKAEETKKNATGLMRREALKTAAFWMVFIGVIIGSMMFNGFKTQIASLLTQNGMSTMQSSTYSALLNLFGCFFVYFGGRIAQKSGNKKYVALLYASYAVGTFMLATVVNPSGINAVLLTVAVAIVAIASPCITALAPTITTEAFGNRDYDSIMIFMTAAIYIGQATIPFVIKNILSAGIPLVTLFFIMAGMAVAGMILVEVGILVSPHVRGQKSAEK